MSDEVRFVAQQSESAKGLQASTVSLLLSTTCHQRKTSDGETADSGGTLSGRTAAVLRSVPKKNNQSRQISFLRYRRGTNGTGPMPIWAMPYRVRLRRRDEGAGPGEELGEVHRAGGPGEFALAVKEEQRRVARDFKPFGEVRKRSAIAAHARRARGSVWTAASSNADLQDAAVIGPDGVEQYQQWDVIVPRVPVEAGSSSRSSGRPSSSASRQVRRGGALLSRSRGRRLSRSQ